MVNSLIDHIYASQYVEDADGNRLSLFPTAVSREDGLALYNLVRATRARNTLETGLAYGLSTLFMCQALCDQGAGSHTAVDPNQRTRWKSIGLLNVERAGLDRFLRFVEAPSDRALPQLALAGERFDVVFIDGSHRFDHVLLDFYYADQLLRVGGYIMLDDVWMPAVRKACSFILRNRRYAPAPEFLYSTASWGRRGSRLIRSLVQNPLDVYSLAATARLLAGGFTTYCIVRKVSEDNDRPWDHYKSF
jgi:predicted O-methyltransferase YrrM